MKHLLSTLSVLLFTCSLFAQQGYFKGYVLLTPQDTIFGLIENGSGYDNSSKCNFKKNIDDNATGYSPYEIYGYRFEDGKYYISKEIDGQRYFFEYLIEGRLNIYLKEDIGLFKRYYVEKDTLPFRELAYKSEVVVDDEGIQRMVSSKTHNLILAYYTNDCPKLNSAAMSIKKPDNSSLIRFAKDYHNATCSDEDCHIFEKKSKPVLELDLNGGMDYMFESYSNHISPYTFVNGAMMLNLMVPKISESLYFGLGLGYFEYPENKFISKEYLYIEYGDSIFRWTYETKYRRSMQIPFNIVYNNHRQGFSPIIGASTNILYLLDVKAIAGVNYQKNQIAIKLYGEYGMFSATNSLTNYGGVKLSVAYLLNKK